MKIIIPDDFRPFDPRDQVTTYPLCVWSRAFGGAHHGNRLGTLATLRDVIDTHERIIRAGTTHRELVDRVILCGLHVVAVVRLDERGRPVVHRFYPSL